MDIAGITCDSASARSSMTVARRTGAPPAGPQLNLPLMFVPKVVQPAKTRTSRRKAERRRPRHGWAPAAAEPCGKQITSGKDLRFMSRSLQSQAIRAALGR